MSYFFIADAGEHSAALESAYVPFDRFTIEGVGQGCLFETRYLNRVLNALNSTVLTDSQSPYEGINVLTLRRNECRGLRGVLLTGRHRRLPEVHISGESRESTSEHIAVLKRVAAEESVGFGVATLRLHISNSPDVAVRPEEGVESLRINLWSAPFGRALRGDDSADVLWDYRVASRRGNWVAWRPADLGVVINDSAGTAVGEMVGNDLYIFYPVHSVDFPYAKEVLREFLRAALALRDPVALEEIRQRREEETRTELQDKPVTLVRWSADIAAGAAEVVVSTATELAVATGKPVHISDYSYDWNPQRCVPANDGRLHVCVFAAPYNITGGGHLPDSVFGAPLERSRRGREAVLASAGERADTLILDDEEKRVGEVVGDTVYIHYPLFSRELQLVWNGAGPEALFRRILEEVVFIQTATSEEKATRARERFERRLPRTRQEYIEACSGRFDRALEGTRASLRQSEERVRELQEELVKSIREGEGARRKIEQMESSRQDMTDTYGREFDKLLENPKICDVRIQDKTVSVFTDTLYCTNPRTEKVHEIGRFRIEFRPNGGVRWFNLTRWVDGYREGMQAPHIFPNGEACLGNVAEVIPDLAARYEYAALAFVCIQFVESVEVDDQGGQYIGRWPLAQT